MLVLIVMLTLALILVPPFRRSCKLNFQVKCAEHSGLGFGQGARCLHCAIPAKTWKKTNSASVAGLAKAVGAAWTYKLRDCHYRSTETEDNKHLVQKFGL